MSIAELRIDPARLMAQLDTLAAIGMTTEGACCRLALSDEDRAGRDLVVQWMRELGLQVQVDAIGNIFGRRAGSEDTPPVMTGSHIDTGSHRRPLRRQLWRAGGAGSGAHAQRRRCRFPFTLSLLIFHLALLTLSSCHQLLVLPAVRQSRHRFLARPGT